MYTPASFSILTVFRFTHSCGLTDIGVGQLSAIFVLSPWPDKDVFRSTHSYRVRFQFRIVRGGATAFRSAHVRRRAILPVVRRICHFDPHTCRGATLLGDIDLGDYNISIRAPAERCGKVGKSNGISIHADGIPPNAMLINCNRKGY